MVLFVVLKRLLLVLIWWLILINWLAVLYSLIIVMLLLIEVLLFHGGCYSSNCDDFNFLLWGLNLMD